jgi:hypothetical protein
MVRASIAISCAGFSLSVGTGFTAFWRRTQTADGGSTHLFEKERGLIWKSARDNTHSHHRRKYESAASSGSTSSDMPTVALASSDAAPEECFQFALTIRNDLSVALATKQPKRFSRDLAQKELFLPARRHSHVGIQVSVQAHCSDWG